MELSNKLRNELEAIIYATFDKLDKTKTNSEHYKKIFSSMDNKKFLKFISLDFPYRFHVKPFVIEPSMEDISNACDYLGVPLFEKVNLPYLYRNKDGKAVNSKECLVIYIHTKKVQQFITKKNSMSVEISQRDMKTGLLNSIDKNGKSSDREMEAFSVIGLTHTMREFGTAKADYMKAKNIMYNTISIKGQVSEKDIPIEPEDSLSKNLLSTYLIGAFINTNLINTEYYLPYTLKNKKKKVERLA